MTKQSKIIVKHLLNTDLKHYAINKTEYYSVYVLLTTQGKNTKFRSIAFDELYSEMDFKQIISLNNKEDKELINNEISVVENISNLVINELGVFDTHFITAYFKFLPTIKICDIDDKTSLKSDDYLILKTIKTILNGISLFEFYNLSNQELIKSGIKTNIEETLKNVNRSYFYMSLSKFRYFLSGSTKNKVLLNKYEHVF